MITIQATLNGQPFQTLIPLLEQELTVTDSQLNQIAKIVRDDVTQNLEKGLDYFGNPVSSLAPSTIKRKGHSRVFFETGELFKSILYQKVTSNEYEVYINSSRDLIMSYLQQGSKANNLPKREAFGVTTNAQLQIEKVLSN